MGLRPHFEPKLQGFRIRLVGNRLPMTKALDIAGGCISWFCCRLFESRKKRHTISIGLTTIRPILFGGQFQADGRPAARAGVERE